MTSAGAALGGMVGGPAGAGLGASLGTAAWVTSKVVSGAIHVSKGHEGEVRIKNTSSQPVVLFSYDKYDRLQLVSYASVEVAPGAEGTISATEGVFGKQDPSFFLHIYVKDGKIKKKTTSGYGNEVRAKSRYEWNGERLCSV